MYNLNVNSHFLTLINSLPKTNGINLALRLEVLKKSLKLP